MQIKYFKKFVTSVLIISFVVPLPYLITEQAYAQTTQGGYGTSAGYGGSSAGIGGYLSGLAPAIAQLPLCKSKLNGVAQNLFRKAYVQEEFEQYLSEDTDRNSGVLSEDDQNFLKEQAQAQAEAESIAVYDKNVQDIIKKIDKTTAETKSITKSLEENDTCLKSIGRMVTKLVLQKITVSTVAWIQGGFEGNPAFVQNPGSFFKEIAKNEILQFGAEINNETLYPFGKAFLIAQAEAFNAKFADNARYSLNELIINTTPQYSAITFSADFAAGGWNAWTAMTSVPANNPLGFQLMASNELSKRLEGTYKSQANEVREALIQANGYLGDQRCADPEGLTREENNALLEAGAIDQACKRWEYVTPGKMISEAATTALNYPSNNLLKSDDLNDAVAAILDALLSRFSTDLMNKGFADFSNQGADGAFVLNAAGLLSGGPESQTVRDFSRFQLGTQWLQDHPNFNIRTDVTQALIDEQRIYRTKLEEQNKTLTVLTKTIFQLDYCIPGPHPGWERDSREVLSAVENTIVSKTADDFKNLKKEDVVKLATSVAKAGAVAGGAIIGASIGTAVLPVVGTVIGAAIGIAVGLIIDFISSKFFGDNSYELLTLYYGTIVNTFTGIPVDMGGEGSSNLRNKQEVVNGFDSMLNKYIALIHKYYTPEYLPPVAKDAAKEFRKAIGYNQTINDNNDKIVLLNSIVKRLTTIKDGIQALNAQYPQVLAGTATPQQEQAYETALEDFKGEFSRLTSNMVTGDDIAIIDNLTRQARDEIKYVYDDLLTGPYGCEQDLRNNYRLTPGNPSRTWILRGTKRATYPVKLWYDYNEFAPNAQLPSPLHPDLAELKPYTEKTTSNQMPSPDPNNVANTIEVMGYGPGFLSAVWYNHNSSDDSFHDPEFGDGSCGQYLAGIITNNQLLGHMLDCMHVVDVWRQIDGTSATPTVGRKQFNGAGYKNDQKESSFEQTIGVY